MGIDGPAVRKVGPLCSVSAARRTRPVQLEVELPWRTEANMHNGSRCSLEGDSYKGLSKDMHKPPTESNITFPKALVGYGSSAGHKSPIAVTILLISTCP